MIPVDLAATQTEPQANELVESSPIDRTIDDDRTVEPVPADTRVVSVAPANNARSLNEPITTEELLRHTVVSTTQSTEESTSHLSQDTTVRGAPDAFEALTELYSMTNPPTNKTELKAWEDRREDLEEGAEDILPRFSQESLVKLIESKLSTDKPTQRRAVIETPWYVTKTPASVLSKLREWQDSSGASFSAEIAKLLNRE